MPDHKLEVYIDDKRVKLHELDDLISVTTKHSITDPTESGSDGHPVPLETTYFEVTVKRITS